MAHKIKKGSQIENLHGKSHVVSTLTDSTKLSNRQK